ncbi:hypothetical protein BSL78_25115 [Apostichopus japonicus]|uniref:Uncharacterized protein n=1 Tax=Stichopus japonicus TaxID=307972 RepID=A0A2G8JQK6_STIJA|nr:hypothetical protein BSL78_25115 [Apostichopus japonicus]
MQINAVRRSYVGKGTSLNLKTAQEIARAMEAVNIQFRQMEKSNSGSSQNPETGHVSSIRAKQNNNKQIVKQTTDKTRTDRGVVTAVGETDITLKIKNAQRETKNVESVDSLDILRPYAKQRTSVSPVTLGEGKNGNRNRETGTNENTRLSRDIQWDTWNRVLVIVHQAMHSLCMMTRSQRSQAYLM